MSKYTIRERMSKLIDDPDMEAEDKYVKFTTNALDDIFVKRKSKQALDDLRTSVRFLRDEYRNHPRLFANAWGRIEEHLINIFKDKMDPYVELVRNEKLLRLNIILLFDLLYLAMIENSLRLYKLYKSDDILELTLEILQKNKEIKLYAIDPDNYPEAYKEVGVTLNELGMTKDKEVNKLFREVKSAVDEISENL